MTDHKTVGKNVLQVPVSAYAAAGVDIDAGNLMVEKIRPLVRATARPGSNSEIGGFGGLFDLRAAGFHDPVLVAANDGVGTKLKIAGAINNHRTIGIDLVAMCVNDLIVQGAEPLFFLDYFATGKVEPDTGVQIVSGIAQACREAGCALIGGETAEMPGLYGQGDYDLAGFAVGAAERGTLLPRDDIRTGDIVLGLRSSGLHSNGFSLVRRIIEAAGLDLQAPCPFAPDQSLGESLLVPTRLYVRSLLAALRSGLPVKALAHITGGGFSDNIPRCLPPELSAEIDLSAFAASLASLPVFGWLAAQGQVEMYEMLRIFNCGIGMTLVTAEENYETIVRFLESHGEQPCVIGRLVPSRSGRAEVIFQGRLAL